MSQSRPPMPRTTRPAGSALDGTEEEARKASLKRPYASLAPLRPKEDRSERPGGFDKDSATKERSADEERSSKGAGRDTSSREGRSTTSGARDRSVCSKHGIALAPNRKCLVCEREAGRGLKIPQAAPRAGELRLSTVQVLLLLLAVVLLGVLVGLIL